MERARFEAERAARQFDACEPENRLVARPLERKLGDALAGVQREQRKLAALELARPAPLSDHERRMLGRLARDLPKLRGAKTTSDRDRKELLRTLISDRVDHRQTRKHRPNRDFLGKRRPQRAQPACSDAAASASAPTRTPSN